MTRRLRLLLVLVRPAVALLFGVYAAIGLAEAGHGEDRWLLLRVLVVVTAFLLFSVACNDIADERIDRVNLPGDARRPLVAGTADRREMRTIGATSAVLALGVAVSLGWPVAVVTAVGLLLSAGYSVRPVRIADRGAAAALLLPACYVAVPYLDGFLAASHAVRPGDLLVLAGLYVAFLGRILLKDFRDVRGDALFGKRTYLVRHGRRWTCAFSATGLTVGTVVLVCSVPHPTAGLVLGYAAGTLAMLALLTVLARDPGHRKEEAVISAIAVVGRCLLLMLLAHLAMSQVHWPPAAHEAVLAALAVACGLQAATMYRNGPPTRRLPLPEATVAPACAASGVESGE